MRAEGNTNVCIVIRFVLPGCSPFFFYRMGTASCCENLTASNVRNEEVYIFYAKAAKCIKTITVIFQELKKKLQKRDIQFETADICRRVE